MADPTRDALLAAVVQYLRDGVMNRGIRQRNGGNYSWWPLVAVAMAALAGKRKQPSSWREDYRSLPAEVKEHPDSITEHYEVLERVLEQGVAPGHEPKTKAEGPRRSSKKRSPTVEDVENLTAEEILGLTDTSIRVERAEAKARLYKRLYNEAIKRASFVEAACDMLKDIVVAHDPVAWVPPTFSVHIKRYWEAVLLLADLHIGDRVDADVMGALNVYNFEIFKQKRDRLFVGVREGLEMLRDFAEVSTIHSLVLGDTVTGVNIFPGQAHHIEFGAMEQAVRGADELSAFHLHLLDLPGIEKVRRRSVPGNHGRPGRKGQDPFQDNWDLVLYEFERLRLAKEPRIDVQWYKSWWMLENILGWDFLCAHGDEVKAWNGIPNYGFRRWAARWRELLDSVGKRYDYGVIGHHHVDVEERNLIISGAWPGASFFSAKELQSGGPATQMFYSVSQDYGITWRRRLPLDPPRRTIGGEGNEGHAQSAAASH